MIEEAGSGQLVGALSVWIGNKTSFLLRKRANGV